jgi:hypothetical protein
MKNSVVITLALGVVLVAVVAGCQKDITVINKSTAAVTDTVSFGKTLVPIFTANCALTSCHAEGGHAPTLTNEKAYSSLIGKKFVDTAAAEKSIIYERLTGVLSPAMPMGKPTDPSNINALILAWIKQGAKNN